MNTCHVVAGLHPKAGGPSRTVVQLTDALAAVPGVRITVITQGRSGEPQVPSLNPKVSRHTRHWQWKITGTLGWAGKQTLHHVVAQTPPDILHSHGLWQPLMHWTARYARRADIPLVIHPRGMLEPWALAYRGWKKRWALTLYQMRDLETAMVLLATAQQEAEHFRQMGLRQPIAVIPNGVELPAATQSLVPNRNVNQTKRALFLSRIHPKKGLLNLLDAWACVQPQQWQLQLAGPDEGGHLAEVMHRAQALGLQDRIEYLGSVDGEQKAAVYQGADLFILPTFSENFGVVVAEALAYGLPVITTHGAPWAGLVEHRCGWWVEPTVDGLVGALRDAVAKEPLQLQEMGMRGQVYAREFDWGNIARQTVEVYRWVLGQGERPACILPD